MTSFNDLPDELISLLCSFGPLDNLTLLSRTNQRLRGIAKPQFESTVQKLWPWIPSWSRQAFEIDGKRQKLLKRSQTKDVAKCVKTPVPKDHIHVNEPVPKDAFLLRDPQQVIGSCCQIDYRKTEMVIKLPVRTVFPAGCHSFSDLQQLRDTLDSRGHLIKAFNDRERICVFAIDPDILGDDRLFSSEAFNEWFYQACS